MLEKLSLLIEQWLPFPGIFSNRILPHRQLTSAHRQSPAASRQPQINSYFFPFLLRIVSISSITLFIATMVLSNGTEEVISTPASLSRLIG